MDPEEEGNEDNDNDSTSTNSRSTLIPPGHLPSYLADAFAELYQEDGLLVLGKGLGCLALLAALVRFYADPEDGHLALLREQAQEQDEEQQSAAAKAAGTKHNNKQQHPQPQQPPTKPPLVLVLSVHKEHEQRALMNLLTSWGTPPEWLPTIITSSITSSNSSSLNNNEAFGRRAIYQRGGVCLITSRILITDLLTHTLNANDIAGLIVYHAHQVTPDSTEAFILRIFHSQKQPQGSGFVKGLSDNAEGLLYGSSTTSSSSSSLFGKVQKVLQALRVPRLYLYPRFQEAVRQELEHRPPHVAEYHQPLSPLQTEIQHAIAAAVQACWRELQQATRHLTTLDWNHTKSGSNNNNNINSPGRSAGGGGDALSSRQDWFQIENCVTAHFDRAISKQLEPEWHKLPPKTKQLVQDLRTLRTLFQALLQYDCVSFYKFLTSLQTMSAASRHPSLWLLTPAANVMFRKAKERVYRIQAQQQQQQQEGAATAQENKLETVLEENPKWKLLKHVLEEIQTHNDDPAGLEHKNSSGPRSVLVMVKDESTLKTVKAYLTGGKKQALALTWLRFLESQNERSRNMANMATLSEERRLLLEEEGRVRRILFGQQAPLATDSPSKQPKKRVLNQVPAYLKKRRRVAAEQGRGGHSSAQDLERNAVLDDAVQEMEHDLRQLEREDDDNDDDNKTSSRLPTKSKGRVAQHLASTKEQDRELANAMFTVTNPSELRIILRSYTSLEGEDYNLFLQDVRPSFIAFYDVNVAFIRSVEVFSSLKLNPTGDPPIIDLETMDQHKKAKAMSDVNPPLPPPLKVYFLIFDQSAEEKNFKKSLEREKDAFERLIHHKITMPAPTLHDITTTQEMQQSQGSGTSSYGDGMLPLAFDSRKGKKDTNQRRDIAVDVREFRSALPCILHQGGMRLAPVTLTVGDFVLSNVHCIERKSISDLFGSFLSGRLYTQAEAMCKHYKAPSLLIEFDPSKSFSLQNANELGVDIKHDSICSKITLLVMHFPALSLLWSKSPHETLKLFRDLKQNHQEVDVERAVEVGRNETLESLFDADKAQSEDVEQEDEEEINESARHMLMQIPGMNVPAARRLMEQGYSLAEMCQLSRDELRKVAGPAVGQKIFTFLRKVQDMRPT